MPNKPAALNDPFRGMKSGSWSKYGGARQGLIHSEAQDTWYCQCCGQETPMSLPGFMVRDEETEEYTKICSVCFYQSRQINYGFRSIRIAVVENRRD